MGNEEIKRLLKALDTLQFAERIGELNRLKQEFGESFDAIVAEHVAEQTREEWTVLAGIHPRNNIQELVDIQWEHISRSGGFEFQIVTQTKGTTVNCSHCPLADMANHLNAAHWGYLYYCKRSEVAVETFNPALGFSRSKTLMQGDDLCDHHYYVKG